MSRTSKQAQWRSLASRRIGPIRAMTHALHRALRRVGAVTAAEAESVLDGEFGPALRAARTELDGSFSSAWRSGTERAGDAFLPHGQRMAQRLVKAAEARTGFSRREEMAAWIDRQVSTGLPRSIETTLDRLSGVFREAIEDRVTLDEMQYRIGRAAALSRERAYRIARTEVIAAANAGTHVGAIDILKRSSRGFLKDWLDSGDKRVRELHDDVQPVGLDELFRLDNGMRLAFPGDRTHGARGKGTVNCRCGVGYKAAPKRHSPQPKRQAQPSGPPPEPPRPREGDTVRAPDPPKVEDYRAYRRLTTAQQQRARNNADLAMLRIDVRNPDIGKTIERDSEYWKLDPMQRPKLEIATKQDRPGTFNKAERELIVRTMENALPPRALQLMVDAGVKIHFKKQRGYTLGSASYWNSPRNTTRRNLMPNAPVIELESRRNRWLNVRQMTPETSLVHEAVHVIDSILDAGRMGKTWSDSAIGHYGATLLENARKEVAIRRAIWAELTSDRRARNPFDFTFRSYEGEARQYLGRFPAEYLTVNAEHYWPAQRALAILGKPSLTLRDRYEVRTLLPAFSRHAPNDPQFVPKLRAHARQIVERARSQAPQASRLLDYLASPNPPPKHPVTVRPLAIDAVIRERRQKLSVAKELVRTADPASKKALIDLLRQRYNQLMLAEADALAALK